MPDRHTLLTVIAGTSSGMPPLTAAWRAVIWPVRLDDLAHDHVLDLVAGHAGPVQGPLDGDPAEVGGGLVLEASEEATNGGTGPGDDDGRGHAGGLPATWTMTVGRGLFVTIPPPSGGGARVAGITTHRPQHLPPWRP